MRRTTVVLMVVCLGGCTRDLPESELGEHALAIFRDFDNAPAELPASVEAMDAALDALDLEGSRRHRMFDLPELTSGDYAGLTVAAGIDTSDQMRASMVALSPHSLDEHLAVLTEVNQSCINAGAVKCHERLPAAGSAAADFIAGTAEVFRSINTIRIESVKDIWLQAPVDLRHVTLSDGRRAVVSRTWLERGFTTDNGRREWQQRFAVDVFIEDPADPSRTRRYYATWLGPSLHGVPALFVTPAVRRGIDDGFTNADDWIEDPSCNVVLSECLADSPF